MAENGVNLALVEERGDDQGKVAIKLPGTRQGDMSRRAFRPEVRVTSLTFSPTGESLLIVDASFLLFGKGNGPLIGSTQNTKIKRYNYLHLKVSRCMHEQSY